MSNRQIVCDLLIAPIANSVTFVRGDVISVPSLQHGTAELMGGRHREADIPGRMAFAAVTESSGKIAPAILVLRCRGIGLEAVLVEKREVPESERPTLIERKGKFVGACGGMNGRQSEKI